MWCCAGEHCRTGEPLWVLVRMVIWCARPLGLSPFSQLHVVVARHRSLKVVQPVYLYMQLGEGALDLLCWP